MPPHPQPKTKIDGFKRSKLPARTKGKNKDERFNCQFCRKSFAAVAQLGGHVAKGHPGMSEKYKHMISVRDRRSEAREALKQAKDIYAERTCCDPLLNRAAVKVIRNELLMKAKMP